MSVLPAIEQKGMVISKRTACSSRMPVIRKVENTEFVLLRGNMTSGLPDLLGVTCNIWSAVISFNIGFYHLEVNIWIINDH